MYATPGNHDWYDGLVSFLRLFCANHVDRRLADAPAAQLLRAEAAERLVDLGDRHPARHVPRRGRSCSTSASSRSGRGDKIVLLTAKPSWIAALDGHVEPPTWKYLNFFEERMVRDTRRAARRDDHRRPPSLRALRARGRGRGGRADADHGGRRRRLPVGDAHAARDASSLKTLTRKRGERVRRPAGGRQPPRSEVYPTAERLAPAEQRHPQARAR